MKYAFYAITKGSISPSLMFAPAASNHSGNDTMSAQDLPATARAMAVVIAIALVATAFAPLLFTAARVVA